MNDDFDRSGIAAEYVLRTLDDAEQAEADALRLRDAAFDHLVRDWESCLSPLLALVAPLDPPAGLFRSIDAATRGDDGRFGNVVALRRQVGRWRSVAITTSALAAALAAWVGVGNMGVLRGRSQTYMAVLQQGAGTPSFLVSVDFAQGVMTVVPADARTQPDKSYELWMIAGQDAPLSLGVLNAESPAHPLLPKLDPALISKATYAVTLEPPGGSPTGKPTSTPMFVGRLVDATR